MIRNIFLIFSMILCFSGCSTLAPDYSRPDAPVPDEWPRDEAYQNAPTGPGAEPIPELSRQEFFADPNLQQIIEMALNNNRDLRLAALNVERARALYGIQRAELFPAVNVDAEYSKESVPGSTYGDIGKNIGSLRTEQYSVGLGIAAWEIDFFGRIRSLKDQALEEYLATDEARRSAQVALVSEIASVYLTLAADRENLALARSTLATQQAAYDLIRRQYEVGVATELDVRQAQIPVDTARADMARFTRIVAQDKNALNLLAGSTVPEALLPVDLESVDPPKEIFPSLPSVALLKRPDIMAAEHRLKGAYAFIGAARAAFFPQVSLTTAIGTTSDELSGLFGAESGTWRFAPQISVPIFDARTWAAYRVSKAQREIALAQYEKTIQTAFKEVTDALAVQGTVDQQLSAQQSLTNAVSETYRLADKRYEKGIDSYLGVLDAQRSLYAAQQGLISVRLAKLVNQVRLYAVLGGGVDAPDNF